MFLVPNLYCYQFSGIVNILLPKFVSDLEFGQRAPCFIITLLWHRLVNDEY
jgi:hypothetical protein